MAKRLMVALTVMASTVARAETCVIDQVLDKNADEAWVVLVCDDGSSYRDVVRAGLVEGDAVCGTNDAACLSARDSLQEAVRAAQAAIVTVAPGGDF